jgi:hypothetical protein
MAVDDTSAPGSSVYDSSTMFVGDGTWDSTKNTFLLPNLQGLNFATMQLNSKILNSQLLASAIHLTLRHQACPAVSLPYPSTTVSSLAME